MKTIFTIMHCFNNTVLLICNSEFAHIERCILIVEMESGVPVSLFRYNYIIVGNRGSGNF